MHQLRATVFGEVQGVNYRNYVKQRAEALGLKGYVRNLNLGSVEVVAEGEEEPLLQLLDELWEGPSEARVTQVEDEWERPRGKWQNFQIATE